MRIKMPRIKGIFLGVKGIEEVRKSISSWAYISRQAVAQSMFTAAHAVYMPEVRDIIRRDKIIFRGELFQRLAARIAVVSLAEVSIEVGSLGVPYTKAVEVGTGPRTIDAAELQNLTEWVRLKLGVTDRVAAASIAGQIAAKIKRRGSMPHPHLLPAWKNKETEYWQDVQARLPAYYVFGP